MCVSELFQHPLTSYQQSLGESRWIMLHLNSKFIYKSIMAFWLNIIPFTPILDLTGGICVFLNSFNTPWHRTTKLRWEGWRGDQLKTRAICLHCDIELSFESPTWIIPQVGACWGLVWDSIRQSYDISALLCPISTSWSFQSLVKAAFSTLIFF